MKFAPLSSDLELLVLHAVIQGHVPLELVKPEELSKEGQYVWKSAEYLARKHDPPFSFRAVFVTATDILGGNAKELRTFVKRIKHSDGGADSAGIVDAVRTKQRLIALINAAGDQLGTGKFDLQRLIDAASDDHAIGHMEPLSFRIDASGKELPSGPRIRSLPRLSEASGGIFGFVVIGGEPGVGKSTLAIQIAVSLQVKMPVLYYDFEQGEAAILSHLNIAFKGDQKKLKRATKQLYLRDSFKSFSEDLRKVKPPAVIMIDSLQKAPTSQEYRREGIDYWVHRFERLKKKGYTVVAVSEINRAFYNESQLKGQPKARLGGYKESGEIEYSSDLAMQIVRDGHSEDTVELHFVKNRNRKKKGYICSLERVNEWWLRELP